ncbi:MAG TPA: DUF1232 domain-containing protein [Chitinophagales bacterium]|nr:DUF1232 domain-containing protein [Chitinophagales bacterium]
MAIGKFKIELYFDQLFKKAEAIASNNRILSSLIDKAFVSIGETTGKAFDLQDQGYAMMRMLKAWYAREYTDISYKNVLTLIASAVYIVNPIDLIPDFIPFIGRLDDKLVLAFMIKRLNDELQRFMAWEEAQLSNS